MRVLHVTAYFAPAFRYGGPPRTILGLCQALGSAGVDVEVFTTTANAGSMLPAAPDGVEYDGVRARYFPLARPARAWRAAGLADALARAAATADLVHVHGLWNATAWAGMRVARAARVPYVVSPRGMLQPEALRRRRSLKAVADRLVQKRYVSGASLLHATSQAEADALARVGPRVAVVPNGVEMSAASPAEIARFRERFDLAVRGVDAGGDPAVIAFVGRLHPIKRLDLVAAAFARLRSDGRRARLVIAGPDEDGYRRRVEPLFRGAAADVRWIGAVDGEAKRALFAVSRAVVQCSDSESFGLSVAEALSVGVPVVVTERGAWGEVRAHGCGYVVAHEAGAIADALRCLVDAPDRARAMGARGREWMRDAFSWDAVGRAMAREYERACEAFS
jgi:glycosyltransferase involved in cell wall biosynthesis